MKVEPTSPSAVEGLWLVDDLMPRMKGKLLATFAAGLDCLVEFDPFYCLISTLGPGKYETLVQQLVLTYR